MRIAFVSAGAPRHGKNLQQQVQRIADSSGWGWETSFGDWDYSKTWGYKDISLTPGQWLWNVGNFGNFFEWSQELKAQGVKTIAHWIGSDLLQHTALMKQGIYIPFYDATLHIADAPHLVEEAIELTTLPVGYVRSIPPKPATSIPITTWSRILSYVPMGREEFFHMGPLLEIAGDNPGIEFHLLRPGATEGKVTGNVVEYPEMAHDDVLGLLQGCFAYLRLCAHDGIGLTLIEAAQMGRWVLHNIHDKIPYTIPAGSTAEVDAWLDWMQDRRRPPPPAASAYYTKEYSEDALSGDLEKLRPQLESL